MSFMHVSFRSELCVSSVGYYVFISPKNQQIEAWCYIWQVSHGKLFSPISKKRFLKIKVKCNITSSFELLWYVLTKRECEEKTVDVLYWFWSGSGDTVITCKTLMATAILKTLNFVCYLNHLVNTCISECNLLLIQKCSLYVLTGAVSERREERVLL